MRRRLGRGGISVRGIEWGDGVILHLCEALVASGYCAQDAVVGL